MQGGKRKNAGRKPKPDKKQMISMRLDPAVIQWLKNQPESMTKTIEAMAQEKMNQ